MATHLTQQEKALMDELMDGLDDAFSDYSPSPVKPKHTLCSQQPPTTRRDTKPRSPLHPRKIYHARGKENSTIKDGIHGSNRNEFKTGPVAPNVQPPQEPPSVTHYNPLPCTRCIVTSVNWVDIQKYQAEKHLIVCLAVGPKKLDLGEERRVVLKDDWVSTDVHPGDTINVIGHFSLAPSSSSKPDYSICISAAENMVVLHPDLLLTSTSISSASRCIRKPVISSLLHSPFNVTESSTMGNMLHQVMQTCLAKNEWGTTSISREIDSVVHSGFDDLLRISMGVEKAKEDMRGRAKGIQEFSQKFISSEPKPDAVLTETRPDPSRKATLAITGLHDVEEEIWSPKYGLKGKLDVSIQATVREEDKKSKTSSQVSCPMPFEIKTGRTNGGVEHRAQTMLYTLLMADRYRMDVPAGLLYYTQSDSLIRVAPSRHEIRALILARNESASYMAKRQIHNPLSDTAGALVFDSGDLDSFLPPTIDQEHVCKKCYNIDGCMLYRKAVEQVEDTSSEIAEIYEAKTAHLTPQRSDFFKRWEHLLSLEEGDVVRFRKELWTMTSESREQSGRCFSNMVVHSYVQERDQGVASTQRHQYRFTRSLLSPSLVPGTSHSSSLLNGHIVKGDAVTVSLESHAVALARGYIIELAPSHVTVGFDKPLNVNRVAGSNITNRVSFPSTPDASTASNAVFRLDKDEIMTGMSRIRHNLANLFFADGDTRRLELVVDLRPPCFETDSPSVPPLPLSVQESLNSSQLQAVCKVMQAKDYALILGMPGTGKTTTVAEIIKELVRRGKTVLLTSYTHSAVDTILLKLLDADFEILRLGNADKIHPMVRKFTLGNKQAPSTLEQLEYQAFRPPVIATTCLSIDHALFSRRTFDYCIVDEASQITLPTCLGPLRFADRFVLVGDHHQLPPLVRSVDARRGGLDVSLFRRLSGAHPNAVVDLIYQYRMNEDIMHLSNRLIYSDRLKCGSEEVARRCLSIPNRKPIEMLHDVNVPDACKGGNCWMEKLLDEKAVFVDTDGVPARDSRVGDLVQNEVEAHLIHHLAEVMLASGIQGEQIGIISPYRQQIKLLCHLFQDTPGYKDIEILTADRSQGRDKDCIVISMVRSNDSNQVGDLLRDWRRLNVSLTRGRAKLVIFGSQSTLQNVPLLNDFFHLMDNKGWILRLPKGADTAHAYAIQREGRAKRPLTSSQRGEVGASKEESSPSRKKKRVEGVLHGRYILRDLVNEM
ncbi:Tripartite DNA replication factor [Tulasnella sp. 403]|nr:Tripartite DNA replication factor [Tulasnella sp. 403]